MNSFNLNFIAISCMAIFFGTGFSDNSSYLLSKSDLNNSNYLFLSDSASDSTKADSTTVAQLIEVGDTEKVEETELKSQTIVEKFAEDSVFLITDKPVEYWEGEMDLFYRFVGDNLYYPIEARKKKQQDKIYVRFVVNKDGSVSKVESLRGKHAILKQEAERVVSLTKWIPAQINGQNVRSLMTIPIVFKLDATELAKKTENSDEEVSISIVEEMPTFEGGMDGFYNYISQNLDYPKSAKRAGIQGRVIVKCIVEKDGSLSNLEIIQSVSEDCDNEVIRVVQNSPIWTAAKKDGKPVKVSISFPVVFKLD